MALLPSSASSSSSFSFSFLLLLLLESRLKRLPKQKALSVRNSRTNRNPRSLSRNFPVESSSLSSSSSWLVLRSEASSRCFRQKVSRPGLLFQTFPRLFPVLRVKKSSEPVVLRVSELPLVAILNVKTNASANQSERNEPFERYRRGHSGGTRRTSPFL